MDNTARMLLTAEQAETLKMCLTDSLNCNNATRAKWASDFIDNINENKGSAGGSVLELTEIQIGMLKECLNDCLDSGNATRVKYGQIFYDALDKASLENPDKPKGKTDIERD